MSNQKIIQSLDAGETINSYNINKFFEDYVLQKEYYSYQFDGWKDKSFYGLIDNRNRAIYPKNAVMAYNSNDNSVSYKNLLFVADAFQDLKKYHKSFLLNNKFDPNSSIYISLNIRAAAADLDNLFIAYSNKLYGIFTNTFMTIDRSAKIKDITTFINQFLTFIRSVSPFVPITRSAFIKSKICPLSVSGLTIDFAEPEDFSDTRAKADKYISDPNFDIFLEHCKRFGFMVDRNAPWRIVADLESPVMKDYYKRYNFTTIDDVFSKCYHVAYYADLEAIRNLLVSFWNTYANNTGIGVNQNDRRGCSTLFAEINSFSQVDANSFDKTYGKNWLTRFYLFTKIHENNLSITQNNFEILYNEAIKLDAYAGQEIMLDYVDRKMQELSVRGKQKTNSLTTADEMLRMLSLQEQPSVAEGINF